MQITAKYPRRLGAHACHNGTASPLPSSPAVHTYSLPAPQPYPNTRSQPPLVSSPRGATQPHSPPRRSPPPPRLRERASVSHGGVRSYVTCIAFRTAKVKRCGFQAPFC
ncbi:hypothetical protein E2C01_096571 [Portunus trituberculatus]|uniref:Uncharacterized protein n=1 Tax=Portunus trituberculatus TaxID=210409 RepID=A0A5B7K7K0_PORTR|nr:hypothetical protein [Portunus trituberculatus]